MENKYVIILADPPWAYARTWDKDPKNGGITYPTLTMEDLKSLPIASIASKDCALFLWATFPKLPECIATMEAWGFRYITVAFTWLKLNPKGKGIYSGMGSWTNSNQEIVLFGKRGHPKRMAKNVKQVIEAPRGRHSAKPKEAHDRILQLLGPLKAIELFARDRHPHFDTVGNEISGKDIRVELQEIIDGNWVQS